MATNSSISVTEGSGKNIASHSIVETTTKELQRIELNDSTGAELGTAANPVRVSPATSPASQPVAGDTAAAATLSSKPVTTGGLAKTANPTAVTDGQVVNALHDKLGKQVVVGSIRDLKVQQQTTITTSTSETTVLTAVASTFLDVYGVICTNISGTGVHVIFKDATTGTERFRIYVPANDTRGFMLPESAAHCQAAVNNNWTATCSASITSLYITMFAVKNI